MLPAENDHGRLRGHFSSNKLRHTTAFGESNNILPSDGFPDGSSFEHLKIIQKVGQRFRWLHLHIVLLSIELTRVVRNWPPEPSGRTGAAVQSLSGICLSTNESQQSLTDGFMDLHSDGPTMIHMTIITIQPKQAKWRQSLEEP